MAINAQDLHGLVRDALAAYSEGDYKNERDNPRHMEIMGDTMKGYFEDNIEVMYSWNAANPSSGAPDPVTSFASTVSFPAFDLTSPENLPGLAAKIAAAFRSAVIRHPALWSVPPGAFKVTQPALPQSSDAGTALMDCIIQPVCAWVKTLVNPAALPGSHAAFTGTAVMSKVS